MEEKQTLQDYRTDLIFAHQNFDKQKDIIKGQLATLQREELIKPATCEAIIKEIDVLLKHFLNTQIIAEKLISQIENKKEEQ